MNQNKVDSNNLNSEEDIWSLNVTDLDEQVKTYLENEFTNPAGEIEIGMVIKEISMKSELQENTLHSILSHMTNNDEISTSLTETIFTLKHDL